jgi:uncharacterized protein YndB with AHSA1/START domain
MSAQSELFPMEITNTRTFPTTRDILFDAFADPKKLKHWWGPEGFTNTIHAFELKRGGTWRFTMHGPDGADFDNTSTFHEITAPERIVFVHHLPVHVFTMTMDFAREGNGTRLTWLMQFEPSADNAAMEPFIMAANEQNFDRLAAFMGQN